MKKRLLTIFSLSMAFLTLISGVSAQTATPKPTQESVTENLSEQITDLKEKIASRVAQLDLVEKRGVVGEVTEVDGMQITISDPYGESRIIDVDEITEFTSPGNQEDFGISDIDTGMNISVLGLYNKQSERVLARFIDIVDIPEYLNGEITDIDEDEFTITLTTQTDNSYILDIENTTTTQEYIDGDFERSGFSQMEVGQQVFATAFPSEDDNQTLRASRILILVLDSTSEEEEE